MNKETNYPQPLITLKQLIQQLWTNHGVKINRIDTQWLDYSTCDGKNFDLQSLHIDVETF